MLEQPTDEHRRLLPRPRRADVADQIHDAVTRHFAHWEGVPGFDFERAFRDYREEALSTPDRLSFSLQTSRLIAQLGNGHTAFSDDWIWQTFGASIGISVAWMSEGWTITKSAHPLLPVAGVIKSIDGVSIDAFFEAKRVFLSGSSGRERALRLFQRPFLFPSAFQAGLDDGSIAQVRRGDHRLTPSARPTGYRTNHPDVFVLTVPSFAEAQHEEEAVRFVGDLPARAKLVLDLRGNGGGDTPQALVSALMPKPFRYWQTASTCHRSRGRCDASWQEASWDAFDGPMAILQDGGTFSAAEDFVVPFKNNGRATIFGTASGGSSGQPILHDLGDGLRLWVSTKRQWLADGTEFEGIGIMPDIRIQTDRAHILSGDDPVMEAALNWIG